MTVTLTYDDTLARVRLSADGLGAADLATVERSTDLILWTTVRGGAEAAPFVRGDYRDTFTRIVSNGWGSPDSGPAWTIIGTPANFSVDGTRGLHSHPAAGSILVSELNIALADVDLTIDVTNPVVPTGAGFENIIRARYVNDSNFVDVRVFPQTGNTVTMAIRQIVGGVETFAGFPTVPGVTATTTLRVRLRASGTLLAAKCWDASASEPAAWNLQMTTTHTTAGKIQIRGQLPGGVSNPMPVVMRWDNLVLGPRVVELDDYEFAAGKQNVYRVRGVETGPIEFVGVGAEVTGVNSSLVPAPPTSATQQPVPGDVKLVLASIRNATDSVVNIPAGWSIVRYLSGGGEARGAAVLGKIHAAGDGNPTVTFTGGVAGADTLAQMAVFRRAALPAVSAASGLNASAQNIVYPGLAVAVDHALALIAAWKQDDLTSIAAPAGFTKIDETSSTAGDDAAQGWLCQIQDTATDIPAGSLVVTGGAAAISRSGIILFGHAVYLNEQISSITPVLDRIWLKSVVRPFLNRPVTVVDWSPEERAARGGAFDVVGRTLAVGVTDVSSGLAFTLDLHAATAADAQTLDYLRASGDILFLHTPAGCRVPGGHVRVDTSAARRTRPRGHARVFSLPLLQIAAPGPDVVGAVSTWQSVLNLYPSWEALLAANPTWADLLARVGAPSEVIVE